MLRLAVNIINDRCQHGVSYCTALWWTSTAKLGGGGGGGGVHSNPPNPPWVRAWFRPSCFSDTIDIKFDISVQGNYNCYCLKLLENIIKVMPRLPSNCMLLFQSRSDILGSNSNLSGLNNKCEE